MGRLDPGLLENLGRQVLGHDAVPLAEDTHALDEIFQLSDIAGPGVCREQRGGIVAELEIEAAALFAESPEKVIGQQHHVVAAFPQGRQEDRDDVEPVVEVLAKAPLGYFDLQVAVGGGHDADVNLFWGRRRPRVRIPSLWITRRIFTCKLRSISPISSRNTVPPSASSKRPARERMACVNAPFSWPKQFGFQQLPGDGAAVDRDKGLVTAGHYSSAARAP